MKFLIGDRSERMRALIRQMSCQADDDVLEAANASALIRASADQSPDCILLDESLGGDGCLPLIRRIVSQVPKTKIVLLSMDSNRWFQDAARSAGVWKCVDKEDLRLLREAVQEIRIN